MDIYNRKNYWKGALLIFAILIGGGTLFYTESFLADLRQAEVKKANLWAQAMSAVQRADAKTDLTLAYQIIQANTTIPVILANEADSILAHKNLPQRVQSSPAKMRARLRQMQAEGQRIEVQFANNQSNYLYYQNSTLLTQLRLYPVVLLVVISLFLSLAYWAFSGSRRAEQNQVWNGLAKETAHQIGTPLSSLLGWLEMLRLKEVDETTLAEMEKDIHRLQTITDRFSKIGSQPAIEKQDVNEVTRQAVHYLRSRSPRLISVELHEAAQPAYAELNIALYEWVIENLIRNAIDAIEGAGRITVELTTTARSVQIDVSDTGRGIPASRMGQVFRPGYSTKKRGWGLGLSLARRIIQEYHHGRITVAASEPGQGTTFRILLKRLDS
ncbi:MAG: HAMP domain-containing sensor histidine kinase [Schleiferiaceae bacterium]|jgi:signal transduction histidine kinase|nr:HAMP domain-containing sensor histidine kinase [Schleiferiaceae bacterium]MDR9441890.1 HAMP domain-containing sensor histidine kinase [Schleiferiaceae bacterium]